MVHTCLCGCGQITKIFRGKPNKFINGHNSKGERNNFYGKNHTGSNNGSWKGGRYTSTESGYVFIHCIKHPFKGVRNYMREHRSIYEKYLTNLNGIPTFIHPSIEIDHINGDKTDNRIENLRLFSKSDHSRLHGIKRGGLNFAH